MKRKTLVLSLLTISLLTGMVACKKEGSSNDNDGSAEITAQSDDQSRVSSETDAAANDADIALEATSFFSARPGDNQDLICDASIEIDSLSDPRTITITYNGSNCLGTRTRTGSIVISMAAGIHWKDAGASVTVTYHDLKITRVSDNKSITINGAHTVTNVTGGLLFNLPNLNSITHHIASSGITVKFDDNTERTWHVEKNRVFTYNNGVVITTSGAHTDGNTTNIAEWGVNRAGHEFTTSTLEPVVVRQDCSFRIVSGSVRHTAPGITGTVTFGLDAAGNPTDCPGLGHYYFKLVWTGPLGNSHTAILPY